MKRQPSGLPWLSMIAAAFIVAWPMQLLEAHGTQRGAAFLIVFPLWFLLAAVFHAVGRKH
jgi:predicted PurR-regulated permease PerM